MKAYLLTLSLLAALCHHDGAAATQSDAGPRLYRTWLAEPGNAKRVAAFEGELRKQHLDKVVPTYQILRTALDWKQCGANAFELPERRYWKDAIASLTVIKKEIVPLIGRVEIVSGYRNAALNSCAGGAKGSVHRQFGAFDAYAKGPVTRATMIDRLCSLHRARGPVLGMGLGIYSGKKFHIDVGLKGYRTWGSTYRRASSPCLG